MFRIWIAHRFRAETRFVWTRIPEDELGLLERWCLSVVLVEGVRRNKLRSEWARVKVRIVSQSKARGEERLCANREDAVPAREHWGWLLIEYFIEADLVPEIWVVTRHQAAETIA
jgi:hypothetical protein